MFSKLSFDQNIFGTIKHQQQKKFDQQTTIFKNDFQIEPPLSSFGHQPVNNPERSMKGVLLHAKARQPGELTHLYEIAPPYVYETFSVI